MSDIKRTEQIADDDALIAGIETFMAKVAFPIDGELMPSSEVVARIQSRVDACTEVLLAEARWHGSVKARDARLAETDRFVDGIRQTILAMYGRDPEVLVKFALRPRKAPEPRTGEQNVIAAARARATREARHTMSAKQKATIHGVLSGPVVLPIPVTAAPASSLAPTQGGEGGRGG